MTCIHPLFCFSWQAPELSKGHNFLYYIAEADVNFILFEIENPPASAILPPYLVRNLRQVLGIARLGVPNISLNDVYIDSFKFAFPLELLQDLRK